MDRLKRGVVILGFILLAAMVLILFGFTAFEAWMAHWLGGILTTLISIGVILAVFAEGQTLWKAKTQFEPTWRAALDVVAVALGGVAAYTLAHDVGLGPVVAASVVGIAAHLVVPKYAVAAYCGSFAGMTSDLLLFSHAEVLWASLASGAVFTVTKSLFPGVGGKLGTLALIGTALMSVSLRRIFLITPLPDFSTALEILVISLIATPLTFYLSRMNDNGPVLASSVVGLIAGLVLHVIYPEMGTNLAVVAICASFAGMSSGERLRNPGMVLLVALFAGVVFIFSTPHMGGAGGKLGTIAFGSVLSVVGYQKILRKS